MILDPLKATSHLSFDTVSSSDKLYLIYFLIYVFSDVIESGAKRLYSVTHTTDKLSSLLHDNEIITIINKYFLKFFKLFFDVYSK